LDDDLTEVQQFREMTEKVLERLDNALFSIEDADSMRSILLETGDYLRSVVGLNNDIILVGV